MLDSHHGNQWGRAFVFVIAITSMTFVYQFRDIQYSNFIDYSNAVLLSKNYNDSDILEEKIKDGYIVWSADCRIPNISAFHESIKNIIQSRWRELKCPGHNNPPLTRLIRNNSNGMTSIKIMEDAVRYYPVSRKQLECCYQPITRNRLIERRNSMDDDRYTLEQPVCFWDRSRLANDLEYLYVYCRAKKKIPQKTFYQNLHSVVVDKKSRRVFVSREARENSTTNTTKRTNYSVVLFGIDSISRLNFIRTMPYTKAFLEQQNWTWLEGYNKIGDNTFPNLMAILTGMNVSQITNTCFSSNSQDLNSCPFIWKNYSQRGYLTAYFEDEAHISTFNYNKYGFLNAPTDYYGRPYMMAGKKLLNITKDGYMNYCMGTRPQAEYLFDYATEFVKRMRDYGRLHFSLFWFNSFSHNVLNQPSVMDKRVRHVLEEMQPHLDSTFVFFVSDHGMRFGPIRETFVGWFEERLPYIYIWVPPVFRAEHPEKYANLIANRNRLTSPFDVYATLQEFIHGEEAQAPQGCPTCHSLFKKAAWDRSCDDAAVESHWCTCSSDDELTSAVETDTAVLNAAYGVLNTVNSYLTKQKNAVKAGTSCASLTLGRILSVRSRLSRTLFYGNIVEYVLVIQVRPSKGLFEATWKSDGSPVKLDDVSRINMYGSQGDCVTGSSDLKKYCYCVKNLEKKINKKVY